jgi:hypothetical protein
LSRILVCRHKSVLGHEWRLQTGLS